MADNSTTNIIIDNTTNNTNPDIVKILNDIKPYVYILTPCYGSVCYTQYMTSLIKTIQVFDTLKIRYRCEFTQSESLISRARNNLIAKAMTDKETTHMLFIDSDIMWNPIEIIKLLIRDHDLCGGIYPFKKHNFENLKNVENIENCNETDLKKKTIKFNFNPVNSNNVQITRSCMEIKHLATGFMMIKRNVIESLQKAYPSTKYIDDIGFLNKEEEKNAFALFDTSVEYGHYLSEDWLFCERWKSIGGQIFADVTIELGHIGTDIFNGKIIDSLNINK